MDGTAKPDYELCVKISTDASLKEMIPPGALVMLTPLIAGTFFGVETLSGVLAGSLVSGVQVWCLCRVLLPNQALMFLVFFLHLGISSYQYIGYVFAFPPLSSTNT